MRIDFFYHKETLGTDEDTAEAFAEYAYDRISARYPSAHVRIFNETEWSRYSYTDVEDMQEEVDEFCGGLFEQFKINEVTSG